MPEPTFEELHRQLSNGGVAPRFISRTLLELQEHYRDLESEGLRLGLTAAAAARSARAQLGDEQAIARAVLARPELRTWTQDWPRLAAGLPMALWVALLPAVSVVYCVDHGATIARWSLSAGLAVLVTAALMLGLQSMLLF